MFSTRPTAAGPAHLTVLRAARREFAEHSALAAEPGLRNYLADMVAPFGVDLRDDLIAEGAGHSHGEMAAPLLAELDDQRPVDVLALAQRMHDVRLGRATATYLGSCAPGDPLAFAVCDQGTASPFTALRLLNAYACARALLVVAEQSTLHYGTTTPVRLPDRHTAVAFLLAAGPTPAITVHQRAGDVLDQEIDRLCAGHQDPVVLRSCDDLPLTGVWLALAAGLETWAAQGKRVVLADHDDTVGLCSVAAFDLTAQPEE